MTRKILALFVACMLVPIWPVFADKPRDGISYIFNFYGDNGNNRVIAPSVALSKKLSDTYYLGANLGVDAITSATKKTSTTTSTASGEEGGDEAGNLHLRVPASLSLTYDKDDDTLTGGGYYSYENTYTGRSLFAAYTRRKPEQHGPRHCVLEILRQLDSRPAAVHRPPQRAGAGHDLDPAAVAEAVDAIRLFVPPIRGISRPADRPSSDAPPRVLDPDSRRSVPRRRTRSSRGRSVGVADCRRSAASPSSAAGKDAAP